MTSLELRFRSSRYLVLWQVLCWTGILFGAGSPFPAAGVALALAAQLLLYIGWMMRLPGGLKGWRLGLLLVPGVNLVWNLIESMWLPLGIMRDAGWPRKVAALLLMVLAALLLLFWTWIGLDERTWRYFPSYDEAEFAPIRHLAVCLIAFGIASGMLNKAAGRLEIQPSATRKRNLQLALVLGVSILVPVLTFCGWTAAAHLRLRKAVGFALRAGFPAEPQPAVEKYLLAPYGGRGNLPELSMMDLDQLELVLQSADLPAPDIVEAAGVRLRLIAELTLLADGDAERVRRCLDGLMRLSGEAFAGCRVTVEAIELLERLAVTGELEILPDRELERIARWSIDQENFLSACRERDTRAALAMLTARSLEELTRGYPKEPVRMEWLPWNVEARCDAILSALRIADVNTPKIQRFGATRIRPYEEIVFAIRWADEGSRSVIDRLQLLRVGLAVERCRREHGLLPGSLEELVPGYLAELPGAQLEYDHGGSEITAMRELYDGDGNDIGVEYRYRPGIAIRSDVHAWRQPAPPEYCPPGWDMTPTEEDETVYWDDDDEEI